MKFLLSLEILKNIYNNQFFFYDKKELWNISAKKIIYNFHFPFLIHYPLFILLSPYFWYHTIQNKMIENHFFTPLLLIIIYILLSIFFDKIQIYSQNPNIDFKRPHFFLLSSVEVSAMTILIWIHPFLTIIGILMSIFHSFFSGCILWSKYLKKKFHLVFLESMMGMGIILFFILIFVIIINIKLSYLNLKNFGIL